MCIMTRMVTSMKKSSILAVLLLSYIWFIALIGYKNLSIKEVKESPGYIIPDESFEDNQPNYIKQYAKKGESRWKEY